MRISWALGSGAAAVLLVGTLAAEDGDDLFSKLDTNKDGFVSEDEVPAEQKELFNRLLRNADKDDDKKLNKDEFQAGLKPSEAAKAPLGGQGFPGRPGGGTPGGFRPDGRRAAEMFDSSDANGDGKLTKEEVPEDRRPGFIQMLQRLNPGGDSLTKEQFVRGMMFMAQRDGGPPPGGPPPGAGRGPIAVIDTNQDGVLSPEEIAGAAKALLTLDKNGDGKLTSDEIFPGMGPGGLMARPGETPPNGGQPGTPPLGKRPGGLPGAFDPQEFRERLKRADANGDGKLSKEEAPEMVRNNFDRLDGNGDGFLDEVEMRQMAQRMMGGQGKRPEGKRPKGND